MDLGDRIPFINEKTLAKWQMHQTFNLLNDQFAKFTKFAYLSKWFLFGALSELGFEYRVFGPSDSYSPSAQFFLDLLLLPPLGPLPSVLGSWHTHSSLSLLVTCFGYFQLEHQGLE